MSAGKMIFPCYKAVSVESLIPYARNSRTHSDAQVDKIAASIKEFGFLNPVIVDGDSGIVAGHGRILAAKKLGMTDVPAIEASHLSDAQRRAYIIADNRLALDAGWDDEMLRVEFSDLQEAGFDLELTGFTLDEIDALQVEEIPEGLTDEDAVPEAPAVPVTVEGDVWLLGKHRVMCGDSTSIDAVDTLMDGQKADMVFTDPPYNIDFKPQRGTHGKILNDSMDDSSFDEFLDGCLGCAVASMNPDTYAFIFTGSTKLGAFEKSIKKFFKIQAFHIWVKNNFGIGYYSRPKHEPFYLCLNGKPIKPQKAPADVWEEKKVHKTIHSCEKPVDLIVRILDTYNKNGLTLDLFGGSGSTLIACQKTNRNCYMMELDPKYCDVIVKRWQDFTGKEAVLESSGDNYNDMFINGRIENKADA